MKGGYRLQIQPVAGGPAFIRIIFHGTQAVIGGLIHLFREKEAQAETGQIRKFPILFTVMEKEISPALLICQTVSKSRIFWIESAATDMAE